MKYALFADIHGNLPAFKAALSDAKAQGAEKYLLLGDYFRDFHWGNEVVELIRGLPSAVVVRGNNEGYLLGLKNEDQSKWNREQFGLIYWNFRALAPENIEYLISLPETVTVFDGDSPIHLAHASHVVFRSPRVNAFHSESFRVLMERAPFSHEEYLAFAREELLSRKDAIKDIFALPKGVYLFGHNHLQFHMEYEGRVFVNPGACGGALDFDNSAAYTLLERVGGSWRVTERRVRYDVGAAIAALRRSGLAAEAPVWSYGIERQILTGIDHLGAFVDHIIQTARRFGETEMPVSNEVWKAAVDTWDESASSISWML